MRDIEIGSIRPPSESNSLLIRVTRGCHWNKCYFCGLYKSMRFSMRPIDETIEDIRRQAQLNRGEKDYFLLLAGRGCPGAENRLSAPYLGSDQSELS